MSTETVFQGTHQHVFTRGASDRTLVLFHGTGGDETSLLRFAPALAADASVLSVRGNSMDEGYPRFFRRLAEGVFDLDDLVSKAHELASFLVAAYRAYAIDPAKTTAFGYSNGANMAAALWLLSPSAIHDAIFVRPMLPIEPTPLPDLSSRRGLILAGQSDRMCPIAEARKLHDVLVACGATVEFVAQAAGHELIADDLEEACRWLSRPR